MKNLIHLALLLLISSVGFLQAQCPTAAYRTIDTSCLFLTFEMDPGIDTIYAYGDTFTMDGLTAENLYGYTRREGAMCTDTLGMQPVTDTLLYSIGEDNYICTIEEGQYFPPCPDSAFISVDEMCITLIVDTLNSAQLSDSLIYNEFVYLFNSQDSNWVVFSQSGPICDNEDSGILNGEVTLGSATCEYTSGVLPITILEFDVEQLDGTISLTWKINSDEPTRNLVLQRSYDGVEWADVHEQNLANYGVGQIMDGGYSDRELEHPRAYYRLFISGVSGEATYSRIMPVTLENRVVNNLFYQPQSRSIMIKAGQNFTGEMYLFNTQGQNILKKEVQMHKNTYQEVRIQEQLAPGIYFVKFDNGLIPPAKIFID